jgi:glycogen(starch) synthase
MFFFASRYEFHNKGIDILIKALGMLNEKLKQEDTLRTISVFFWVPMKTYGVKVELLENKNYYRHIRSLVDMKSSHILQQIVTDFISRKLSVDESFFEKDFMRELKANILTFQRSGNPSILTHNVENEDKDPLIQGLLAEGLDNKPDDKVKVIVYPVYLSGNDGLLNLSYYDAMAGCHFGLFPSYYEPWGYTPLEAAAMGIASLTSDLSGFGAFIESKLLKEDSGIFILKRLGRTQEQEIQDLADIMYRYSSLDHAERVQNKINAKYLSNLADWKHFVKFYIVAHNKALEK